jgi:hypothetical protein
MSSSINNYVAAEANVNMIILKSTMCSKEQTASMGDRMLKKISLSGVQFGKSSQYYIVWIPKHRNSTHKRRSNSLATRCKTNNRTK